MIENEIYCYVNGFLKWNIGKKTSQIVGNKKFFGMKSECPVLFVVVALVVAVLRLSLLQVCMSKNTK